MYHTVYPIKVYYLMVFNLFTELYSHNHSLILGRFHHPRKKPVASLWSLPIPPDPQATSNLLSASVIW